jgi:nucleotide-binding universal stress UspA family protein
MKTFAKVVVPMDFSPGAEHALRFALEVVGAGAATVTVYHVVPDLHVLDPLFDRGHPPVETLDVIRRKAEARVVVDEGDAAEKITQFAAERGADLLVLATHGRTGVQHFFLGSVTEHVLRGVSCPVLIVRLPPG